MHFWYRF